MTVSSIQRWGSTIYAHNLIKVVGEVGFEPTILLFPKQAVYRADLLPGSRGEILIHSVILKLVASAESRTLLSSGYEPEMVCVSVPLGRKTD